jgi:hypothetical protein
VSFLYSRVDELSCKLNEHGGCVQKDVVYIHVCASLRASQAFSPVHGKGDPVKETAPALRSASCWEHH